MANTAILYPLFAQVFLTFFIMFWMGFERVGSIRRGEVKASDIAHRRADFPHRPAMVSNNYHNQFEMPVLFLVLVPLLMLTNQVDIVTVTMAWIYIGIRFLHAYVHIVVRSMTRRSMIFMVSSLVLMAMWIVFAVRVTF